MKTQTYRLLDSGNFKKWEQVGPFLICRPAAQAVWRPQRPESEWKKVDFLFERYSGGEGEWIKINAADSPGSQVFNISCGPLNFKIQFTDFGHLGIFPEQEKNWRRIEKICRSGSEKKPLSILNLFAYTGGATMAAAMAGAQVVHLDSSKSSVQWASENAQLSGLANSPIRWIVDDATKFVQREMKRGSKYDGVILDPPTFGRGSKNEVWKIEEHLIPLLENISKILSDDFKFVLLTNHTPGYTPIALENILKAMIAPVRGGRFISEEMLIDSGPDSPKLPSGAGCFYVTEDLKI